MEHQKILDEINYFRAQKTAEILLKSGQITVGEFNSFSAENGLSFSPLFMDLFPKSLDNKST